VAWLGAAVSPDTALARPFYLRAPDAVPQKDLLQKESSQIELPQSDLPQDPPQPSIS
jgi:hypothetical protein